MLLLLAPLVTFLATAFLTLAGLEDPGSGRSAKGDPGADHLFSVTVYNRGALTLEALRRTVGDDAFFQILRTYYAEYRGGNATTGDFIHIAESISGQDLDAYFQDWLYGQGLPDLPPEAATT